MGIACPYRLMKGHARSLLRGQGGLFWQSGGIQGKVKYDKRDSKQYAFECHRRQVDGCYGPFFPGGNLQGDEYDYNGERRRNPGEFICEADLFEQVLQPEKSDDPNLRLVEDVGIDKDGSDFVEDDERQEKDDGVDRPAGAFEVRAGSEVYQLCLAGAFVFHKRRKIRTRGFLLYLLFLKEFTLKALKIQYRSEDVF